MTQVLRTSAFHKDNMHASCVLQNKIGIHPAFVPFVSSLRSSLGIPSADIFPGDHVDYDGPIVYGAIPPALMVLFHYVHILEHTQ